MKENVKTKYVLVTGGASGIGLAVTAMLSKSGYKVFCADINNYAAKKTKT